LPSFQLGDKINLKEGDVNVSKQSLAMTRTIKTPTQPDTNHRTLSGFISDRFDTFSRSQKDVARYIVDHLDEVAFQTAEELARHASTSSSTVVRFSQALGFEGYPELQQSAREEYRRAGGPAASSNGSDSLGLKAGTEPLFTIDQTPFESVMAQDYVNIEETAKRVVRSDIEAAIDVIASADCVVVAGTDQVAFFASYFKHLLMLLDIRTEIAASPSQETLARLNRIDEKTVVVGMSAGRAHPLVLRAMKLASHAGARTISIADASLSDVAGLADISFFYSSRSPAYVRSHAGLLTLIQSLAHGLYTKDSSRYEDRIKAFRLA